MALPALREIQTEMIRDGFADWVKGKSDDAIRNHLNGAAEFLNRCENAVAIGNATEAGATAAAAGTGE